MISIIFHFALPFIEIIPILRVEAEMNRPALSNRNSPRGTNEITLAANWTGPSCKLSHQVDETD